MGVRHARRRASSRAGYTMIEVMMALAILTVGAVGLMALQAASTRGNQEAREMTTATQLTERWVERLRIDALNWTRSSSVAPDATLLAATDYLSVTPDPGNVSNWFVPAPPAGTSAQFDYLGNETTTAADMHYCTNVRLEWIYFGQALRADVRVWWLRRQSGSMTNAARANYLGCAPNVAVNNVTAVPFVRAVYATTVLRFTPPAAI